MLRKNPKTLREYMMENCSAKCLATQPYSDIIRSYHLNNFFSEGVVNR